MSTNDLQALFANLRPKSRDPSSAFVATTSQPGAIFGVPSNPPPPFSATNPAAVHSDTTNNGNPATGKANTATAQSLLSLLNFGSTNASQSQASSAGRQSERAISQGADTGDRSGPSGSVSASDLVARFISPPAAASSGQAHSPLGLEDQGGGGNSRPPPPLTDSSQDALLKLLSKTTISQASALPSMERTRSDSEKPTSSALQNGTKATSINAVSETSTTNLAQPEGQSIKDNKPLFTYSNPFEALNASRAQTPKSSTPAPKSHSPIFKGLSEIPLQSVETPADVPREGTPEQRSRRKKLTPRLPSAKSGQLPGEGSILSTEPLEPTDRQPSPETKPEDLPAKPIAALASDSIVEKAVSPSKESAYREAPQSGAAPAEEVPDVPGEEWEDADEDSPVPENTPRKVSVYNFPIKPFVSITLRLDPSTAVDIRDDGVMEISRLKKEFDQLDRSLAAATSKYISYALVKNGGMRIIRQDDGSDRQVFKNSHDRVFNIAFCTTATSAPPSDDQAVLGTGVSGAVYYATVSKQGNDLFEKDELESESLVFPPWPPADENTAGGVLKTRAKRSSRHPEFFAIGRGKSIHLIWPATAMSPRYGITGGAHRVDVEKIYQERSLQISTGKAGKDFIFSEDDSLIVSLDKTGRLRFWDIRELTDETNATSPRVAPITIDTPLLSLSTASPAEKSWPTSVLFVDKARPYTKGGALRYVLVGLRQNHTLQLWDIALGKAVQELNFPHENETDAVCSVNYHPNSGIIVVGHPTRNSLFFIHLSAPRYTLSSSISQSVYVQRIAAKDPEIPKPESTACMSGIREISFAAKGQIRSVELLPLHRPADAPKVVDEKTPLFELYVVHSRGVTCLNITKEDLGWSADSKVLHPIDASKEGFVSLKELKLGSVIEESSQSKSLVEEVSQSVRGSKKKTKKAQQTTERAETGQPEAEDPTAKTLAHLMANEAESQSEAVNGETQISKESKKSKKKAVQATDLATLAKSPSRTTSPNKSTAAHIAKIEEAGTSRDITMLPSQPTDDVAAIKTDSISVGISGDWLDKELKKIERGVSTEFHKELSNLYSNIQNDRIVQDSAAAARQEAILRLVSTTLTTNIEKSMTRILSAQVQQVVVPSITGVTVQAVSAQVGDAVAKTLHQMVPREFNIQLPVAINSALSSPQMTRAISDTISHRIAKQTESQLSDVLNKHVVPTFKTLAAAAAEKAASDVEARLSAEIGHFRAQRQHDTARLEKLSQVMQGMAETMQAMSDTQVAFQAQILRDRRQLTLSGEPSITSTSRQLSTARMTPSPAPTTRPVPVKPKSKEEIELMEITTMMEEGRYEEGSIRWLQSSQPVELFDNLFVRFTPEYLSSDVSPLVAFSIAVTVGNSLDRNTDRRLDWISTAFDAVDLEDPEIADLLQHAPTLVGSLIQKLESLYMTVAERNQNDPVLRQIPGVVKKAKDIRTGLMTSERRPNSGFGFSQRNVA